VRHGNISSSVGAIVGELVWKVLEQPDFPDFPDFPDLLDFLDLLLHDLLSLVDLPVLEAAFVDLPVLADLAALVYLPDLAEALTDFLVLGADLPVLLDLLPVLIVLLLFPFNKRKLYSSSVL
jgi:hypothetical protein